MQALQTHASHVWAAAPGDTGPADPLLSEKQTADILGVEPGTLQVWRSTKRYPLPYIKVGRLVRYRRSSVEAFLLSREVSA
jgi:predicted DNA-binding transcriptional regulator AlpA